MSIDCNFAATANCVFLFGLWWSIGVHCASNVHVVPEPARFHADPPVTLNTVEPVTVTLSAKVAVKGIAASVE